MDDFAPIVKMIISWELDKGGREDSSQFIGEEVERLNDLTTRLLQQPHGLVSNL